MLTNLSIKNFALIDNLNVSFLDGLSIITGETGAGKSILLGGLGLILGKRADLSVINDTNKKCIVEAEFSIANYKIKDLFEQEGLDYDDVTIIRREILPSGKSRAFINDSPVSLQSLKLISERLIDIHSQHQTLQLTDNTFQFEVIDALAKNNSLLEKYQNKLKLFRLAQKELNELVAFQQESNESQEYNTFLLNELLEAKLETINQELLEQELEQLVNVEEIQQQLLQANQLLSDEQLGVLNLLASLKSALRGVSGFSEVYNDIFERVNSTHIELEDVFAEIEDAQENIEANPNRLNEITAILNQLNNLQQKHQVSTIDGLLDIQRDLEEKVGVVANLSESIAVKEIEVKDLEAVLNKVTNQLHENREKAIPKLIQQLEKILNNLGMENARFSIAVELGADFLVNGKDTLAFLFSANKGGNFNALKKAASGGELSRIMLAIKAVLSKYKQLPTIMFDEIDTGVSGDVANKMGLLMQYMSENMQVFSITHLPQIASKGKTHFKVYKEDISGVTRTNLKELKEEGRIKEVAEMLGGKDLSDTALSHARELLKI